MGRHAEREHFAQIIDQLEKLCNPRKNYLGERCIFIFGLRQYG